jgi:hypothetical protein
MDHERWDGIAIDVVGFDRDRARLWHVSIRPCRIVLSGGLAYKTKFSGALFQLPVTTTVNE